MIDMSTVNFIDMSTVNIIDLPTVNNIAIYNIPFVNLWQTLVSFQEFMPTDFSTFKGHFPVQPMVIIHQVLGDGNISI